MVTKPTERQGVRHSIRFPGQLCYRARRIGLTRERNTISAVVLEALQEYVERHEEDATAKLKEERLSA